MQFLFTHFPSMAKAVVVKDLSFTLPVFITSGLLLRRKVANGKTLEKSIDGVAWSDVYTFSKNVQSAVISNGNIIVCVDDDFWTGNGGEIHVSTDNGISFTKKVDMVSGASIHWSVAVVGSRVIMGEYGQYQARHVWQSNDAGVNWFATFVHPSETGDVHCHKVAIDPENANNMLISFGDDSDKQGIWYTTNGGTSWTKTTDLQITGCEYVGEYIYLFTDDRTGNIYRVPKTQFETNTVSLEKVFDGVASGWVTNIYSSSQDSYGRIYAAFFDEDSVYSDDGGVFVSENGTTWELLVRYPSIAGTARGPYSLSRVFQNKIYMASAIDCGVIHTQPPYSTLTINGAIS